MQADQALLYQQYMKGEVQKAQSLFPTIEKWPAVLAEANAEAIRQYHTPKAINRLLLSQIIGNNFKLNYNGVVTSVFVIEKVMPDVFATLSGRELLVAVTEDALTAVDLERLEAEDKCCFDFLQEPRFVEGMRRLQELARTSFAFNADRISIAPADQL